MSPDEQQWTWTTKGAIVSDLNAAHSLIDEVVGRVRSNQWNSKDVFALELTLEEAFVNAVTHGNHSDKSKHVRYECKLSPNRFCFTVEDEGSGFDPDVIADPTCVSGLAVPSGRGVHLIRGFSTRADWNEKGNVLTVEIDRKDIK
ncbi:MAG: ATP-binding protein [Planctomycetaceae bacterium]|jgi:serine/threonine-protein kinase RsbW|nr:ATP-binding protein [Planctomycetaceae bacterium]